MVNWTAVGAVSLPFVGGFAGSIITRSEIPNWYKGLKKPSWTPPNWLFGPVWTSLYAGMGYASFRVYDALGGFNDKSLIPLGLYGTQLALNWAWTPLFFGKHKLKWSLIEILALDVAVAATAISFYKEDKVAGLLFIPYLMWLSLASSLTAWIWKNNSDKKE